MLLAETMWSDPDLYDMENADNPTFDHGFWAWVMRSVQPRRVLELACGTGRLTLFLAGLGVAEEVVALDASETFLDRLRSRLPEGSPVTVVHGDMREPAVEGSFDLIVIPFNSLSYLATREDRLDCFRAARALLAPGGRLVFDLVAPRYDFLNEAIGTCPLVRCDTDHPAPEFGVTRFLRSYVDRYDPSTQTLHSTNRYELHLADGTVRHRVTDLDWHIYFPEELSLLLEASGLSVFERFGSYAREAWSPASKRYLWLAGAR